MGAALSVALVIRDGRSKGQKLRKKQKTSNIGEGESSYCTFLGLRRVIGSKLFAVVCIYIVFELPCYLLVHI